MNEIGHSRRSGSYPFLSEVETKQVQPGTSPATPTATIDPALPLERTLEAPGGGCEVAHQKGRACRGGRDIICCRGLFQRDTPRGSSFRAFLPAATIGTASALDDEAPFPTDLLPTILG